MSRLSEREAYFAISPLLSRIARKLLVLRHYFLFLLMKERRKIELRESNERNNATLSTLQQFLGSCLPVDMHGVNEINGVSSNYKNTIHIPCVCIIFAIAEFGDRARQVSQYPL